MPDNPALIATLQGRLRAGLTQHDEDLRLTYDGVRESDLRLDNQCWQALGKQIAALAREISFACATSDFCAARPMSIDLALRMAESIDDQIDAPAWRVIEAAARLAAANPV